MIELDIHSPTVTTDEDTATGKIRIRFVKPKRPLIFGITPRHIYEIPPGYGFAYFDISRDYEIFAIMPLNILLAFTFWAYYLIRIGLPAWLLKHSPAWKLWKIKI